MAKEIKPDLSSSAARFLTSEESMLSVDSLNQSRNSSATLEGSPTPPRQDVPRSLQKVKREFVLTRETDAVFAELVAILRETSSARLSGSHVLRGLAQLLMRHVPAVRSAAIAHGSRRLPSTGPDHALARLEFEKYLASVFELALAHRPPPVAVESADKDSVS